MSGNIWRGGDTPPLPPLKSYAMTVGIMRKSLPFWQPRSPDRGCQSSFTLGFLAAGPITRVLGAKAMDIVTKLMGVVWLAIGAGMFAAGTKDLLPGLPG